jgi:hypothetical protein
LANDLTNGRLLHIAVDRLGKAMGRRRVSFFWKLEVGELGRVHVHLLLTTPIEAEALGELWRRAIDSAVAPRIQVSEITSYDTLIDYMRKPVGDTSRIVDLGRVWGHRGPDAQLRPLCTLTGPRKDIAPIVRPIRKLHGRKAGRRVRRDNGISGGVFRDSGGADLARDVKRVFEWSRLDGLDSRECVGRNQFRSKVLGGSAGEVLL